MQHRRISFKEVADDVEKPVGHRLVSKSLKFNLRKRLISIAQELLNYVNVNSNVLNEHDFVG